MVHNHDHAGAKWEGGGEICRVAPPSCSTVRGEMAGLEKQITFTLFSSFYCPNKHSFKYI